MIFGGSLRTRNSVTEVNESREVLAVHEYSPLMMIMFYDNEEEEEDDDVNDGAEDDPRLPFIPVIEYDDGV